MHPCGGNDFTVVRDSVVVTLRCITCGSIVRMERGKFEKAESRSQNPGYSR
jgi:hypothetical protein